MNRIYQHAQDSTMSSPTVVGALSLLATDSCNSLVIEEPVAVTVSTHEFIPFDNAEARSFLRYCNAMKLETAVDDVDGVVDNMIRQSIANQPSGHVYQLPMREDDLLGPKDAKNLFDWVNGPDVTLPLITGQALKNPVQSLILASNRSPYVETLDEEIVQQATDFYSFYQKRRQPSFDLLFEYLNRIYRNLSVVNTLIAILTHIDTIPSYTQKDIFEQLVAAQNATNELVHIMNEDDKIRHLIDFNEDLEFDDVETMEFKLASYSMKLKIRMHRAIWNIAQIPREEWLNEDAVKPLYLFDMDRSVEQVKGEVTRLFRFCKSDKISVIMKDVDRLCEKIGDDKIDSQEVAKSVMPVVPTIIIPEKLVNLRARFECMFDPVSSWNINVSIVDIVTWLEKVNGNSTIPVTLEHESTLSTVNPSEETSETNSSETSQLIDPSTALLPDNPTTSVATSAFGAYLLKQHVPADLIPFMLKNDVAIAKVADTLHFGEHKTFLLKQVTEIAEQRNLKSDDLQALFQREFAGVGVLIGEQVEERATFEYGQCVRHRDSAFIGVITRVMSMMSETLDPLLFSDEDDSDQEPLSKVNSFFELPMSNASTINDLTTVGLNELEIENLERTNTECEASDEGTVMPIAPDQEEFPSTTSFPRFTDVPEQGGFTKRPGSVCSCESDVCSCASDDDDEGTTMITTTSPVNEGASETSTPTTVVSPAAQVIPPRSAAVANAKAAHCCYPSIGAYLRSKLLCCVSGKN